MASKPTLVVVSGPPSSGKTSLARAIAQAVPCPAICREEIKEGMVHAHGREFTPEAGDPLTQRTFPLFFDVLRVLLEGGVSFVAEAAFQDHLWRAGLEPLADLAQLRIVQCHVDASVAWERHEQRGPREAHSFRATALDEWEQMFPLFERLSLPAPVIDVDTTDGYKPDLPEIVEFVNRR
jgi:predicted kinase